jgi:tRNA (guanosine-2'-O-)-methyltransferase
MLDEADEFLHINMAGFVESLNVSVCAAISLNTLCHRLRNSEIAWQLSTTEAEALRLEWTQKSIRSIDPIIQLIQDGKL